MNRLRVGVVGCGEVTQLLHLPSLDFLSDQFEVAALCDVSEQVLECVADRWRIAGRHRDYRDLLARADLDVVLVANPDAYHAEVVIAALAAGKHVLVEKPTCITLREADEIMAAQRRSGRLVQIGTMRRYAPAFLEACRLLPDLGPIRLARVHDVLGWNHLFTNDTSRVIRGDLAPEVIASGEARRHALITEAIGEASADLRTAYGLLLSLASHDISAMRELIGMPLGVLYAAQRKGGWYMSAAFDYGDFVCQYETGINEIARFDAHVEVYGDERILRVEYDTPYVRNLPIRVRVTEASQGGAVSDREIHPGWGDAFVAEWRTFYANVIEGREPKTSPADFRHDLELFRTMVSSMQSRTALPIETGGSST
jgi:predicted dehydrogenase